MVELLYPERQKKEEKDKNFQTNSSHVSKHESQKKVIEESKSSSERIDFLYKTEVSNFNCKIRSLVLSLNDGTIDHFMGRHRGQPLPLMMITLSDLDLKLKNYQVNKGP
jgi:hypothetical protein